MRKGLPYHCRYDVATVLTVYGIETSKLDMYLMAYWVATVLTVYGIETMQTSK